MASELSRYYNQINVSIFNEKGTNITSKVNIIVVHNNAEYKTTYYDTLDYFGIISFNETSQCTVQAKISYNGYITKTASTLTYNGQSSQDYIKVTLYPETIEGQIQRLTDTKQKFVDTFPAILKSEDSIENYPEILGDCVPLIVYSSGGASLFKIKEIGKTVIENSGNAWLISKNLISPLTIEFLEKKKFSYNLNICFYVHKNNYSTARQLLYNDFIAEVNSGDTKALSISSTIIREIVYLELIVSVSCLIKDTLITLSDGSQKPAQDITFDDELLVWDFYEGKFSKAKPMFIKKAQITDEYNLCKFSDGTELGLVGSDGYHRIWNDEANMFTHTGKSETPIETHTFNSKGEKPKLISQKIIKKPVEYYNIITDKHYNLFANAILTSNRWSNRYAIKDMKYVLDDIRMTDEHINEKIEEMKNNPVWEYNRKK